MSETNPVRPVVVVGAGLAGLTVALTGSGTEGGTLSPLKPRRPPSAPAGRRLGTGEPDDSPAPGLVQAAAPGARSDNR